jgi:hypothetical protein
MQHGIFDNLESEKVKKCKRLKGGVTESEAANLNKHGVGKRADSADSRAVNSQQRALVRKPRNYNGLSGKRRPYTLSLGVIQIIKA